MTATGERNKPVRLLRIRLDGTVADAAAAWVERRLGIVSLAVVAEPGKRRVILECYPPPGLRLPSPERIETELASHLRTSFGRRYVVHAEKVRLPVSAWRDRWKEGLGPVRIGRRLFIRLESWKGSVEPGRIEIVIDPGPAFGTGHHASTRLCLAEIDALAAGGTVGSLLDVGCGTGILSVAAAKLGFDPVLGIDRDPFAVDEARENARRNGVDPSIFRLEDAACARSRRRWDVVVCNMIASEMLRAGPLLRRSVRRGGRLVLGGLLRRDWEATVRRIAPGWPVERTRFRGSWTGVVLRRPS